MWIVNKYGVAINTDHVARFREIMTGELVADLVGLPGIATPAVIGEVAVMDVIANIISGTKIMEVQ